MASMTSQMLLGRYELRRLIGVPALLASLGADEETQKELQERWEELNEAVDEGKSDKTAEKRRKLSNYIRSAATDPQDAGPDGGLSPASPRC